MTLSQLTELLGWASIINIGFLLAATFILVVMKGTIISIHSEILGLSEKELQTIYMKFLASYKTLTLVFIVASYLSLKIMGQ